MGFLGVPLFSTTVVLARAVFCYGSLIHGFFILIVYIEISTYNVLYL